MFFMRWPQVSIQNICLQCLNKLPIENISVPFVFHRFPRKTCVFFTFSIGSYARLMFHVIFHPFLCKTMFSSCFQFLIMQNLRFRMRFHKFHIKTIVLLALSICSNAKSCVFNMFSIVSHATPMFALRFNMFGCTKHWFLLRLT